MCRKVLKTRTLLFGISCLSAMIWMVMNLGSSSEGLRLVEEVF